MGFFNVDKSKCCGDKLCVNDCPIKILRMDESSNVPRMVDKGEEVCIRCGHCVAVCPHGALSLEDMPVSECSPVSDDRDIPADKIAQFLKSRRSARVYKNQPVDIKVLEELIDIARYAPSGINRQPVYWAVIHDPRKVRDLTGLIIDWMRSETAKGSALADSLRMKNIVAAWEKGMDWVCRQAPHLILSYGLKDDFTAPQACTIALTYLELAAVSFGLGTCWAGYVAMAVNQSPEVRRFARISSKAVCYGAMMAGYPDVKYHRIPLRKKASIKYV